MLDTQWSRVSVSSELVHRSDRLPFALDEIQVKCCTELPEIT